MIDRLPEAFTIRPPTMDDVKITTALIRLCDITEHGDSLATESSTAASWREIIETLKDAALLVFAPGGQLVGYARARNVADVKFYVFIRVHPDYAQSGIQAYFLHRMEEFVRQQVPSAPSDARITIETWIGDANVPMHVLFEQEGFSIVRSTWRMEIEMEQTPPEPVLPQGIIIRSFVPGQDERATFEANDEAFRDHWGHVPGDYDAWLRWAIEREDFDPSLYFLACDNDRIAGVSLCLQKPASGWVDDLSVRRPWRHGGVGMALLQHTFREFYRRGIYNVALDVDSQNLTGATRLYQRAGMQMTRRFNTYEKEIRPGVELSTQAL
ncbi:MAG TPA: GNAT family N-acetyltransferase [Ktedonobacteraceae bacterium]|nr:GNAT family N-acetyltransferase [Ktedonobacteraceae bacterium]